MELLGLVTSFLAGIVICSLLIEYGRRIERSATHQTPKPQAQSPQLPTPPMSTPEPAMSIPMSPPARPSNAGPFVMNPDRATKLEAQERAAMGELIQDLNPDL